MAKIQPFWWFLKPTIQVLPVVSYTGYYTGWDKWGVSPYLNSSDPANRIGDEPPTCAPANDGMYEFKNTTLPSISKCVLHIRVKRTYAATKSVTVFLHTTDPLNSIMGHTFTVENDDYEDKSYDVTPWFNTPSLVNLCNARFFKQTGFCFVAVAYAYLVVEP